MILGIILLIKTYITCSATIAIIDTGFDLDHDYLKPRILSNQSPNEISPSLDLRFLDNSHLKKPVINDKNSFQEVLRYRDIKAKGHRQGLSVEEFEWYNKKSADKEFMEKVRLFKKHAHGTLVAGIALREGENINIFPIRGLNLPNRIVAVKDESKEVISAPKGKTPEEKFVDEIRQSINRVSRKFSKICSFVSRNKIDVVNASYGITYKNISSRFRERYKEITNKEIDEIALKNHVDDYFKILYEKGKKTIDKHPDLLFVFSAGNSGLNNDEYHHYPSKIKAENAITVAAMNGDYLATFSNYGPVHVDIGAPGVGIVSIVPKVYSSGDENIYSPASGTSMAAPFISNLAAQIKNTNPKLGPKEIKKIIVETGIIREHLKSKLISSASADNQKALRAAMLSRDFPLEQAINLGNTGIIPIEDEIQFGRPHEKIKELEKNILNSIPVAISSESVEDPSHPIQDTSPSPQKEPEEKSHSNNSITTTQDFSTTSETTDAQKPSDQTP